MPQTTRGTQLARVRRCTGCKHCWMTHGWPWHRCAAAGVGPDGIPLVELSDEHALGPPSNCPKGFWDNLEPVDEEKGRAERVQRHLEYTWNKLQPFAGRMSGEEFGDALVELVQAGHMQQELAENLAEKAGVPLDE